MKLTRRATLRAGAGSLTAGVLAGCVSEPPGFGSGNPDGGYAAFFAIWDFAEAVSGDLLTFENPVEVGEMGHGWEPNAGLTRDVARSDVFVYLDTAEFSWAQDIAAEADGEGVHVIDAMAGLERDLLPIDREKSDERETADPADVDPETIDVAQLDVYDSRTGEVIMDWHDDHWHGELPDVERDGDASVELVFESTDGDVLPLGDSAPFQIDARVADRAQEGIVEATTEGARIRFDGLDDGLTRVYFRLLHDGEVLWETSSDLASIQVVEALEATDAPAFYDPHVWVDPVLAQQIVENIADGLAELDPDNESTYRENADAYRERLEAVDRQFRDLAEEADHDVAVLAGHDSFGYLRARYDIEIHTPAGIAPAEVQTGSDIADLIDLVEDHGIDTVLYDPFESTNGGDLPDMVDVILDETDASEYAPVTPAEGTTREWQQAEYGWVEQMEEVTLPSLRQALGVE